MKRVRGLPGVAAARPQQGLHAPCASQTCAQTGACARARATGRVQVEQIEAKDVNEQELFNRIRLLEEGIGAINHEKLSPFHQQEILRRIEELEAQVGLEMQPEGGKGVQGRDGAVAGTLSDAGSSKLPARTCTHSCPWPPPAAVSLPPCSTPAGICTGVRCPTLTRHLKGRHTHTGL